MFIRYRTEGIFLQKADRFEADQLLTAYTKDFGKIKMTGKSIRKIKSKVRSGARTFCYSDLEFIRGRYYNILTDTEVIDNFSKTRKSLGKLSVAFKMSELVDSFLPEEEREGKLWDFIKKSFSILNRLENNGNKKDLEKFYYYFAFKFLEILGYGPEIDCCVIDRKEHASIFSPGEGGLVCSFCSRNIQDPATVKVTSEDILFLKTTSKNTFENFLKINPDFNNLREVLNNYLRMLPSKS